MRHCYYQQKDQYEPSPVLRVTQRFLLEIHNKLSRKNSTFVTATPIISEKLSTFPKITDFTRLRHWDLNAGLLGSFQFFFFNQKLLTCQAMPALC